MENNDQFKRLECKTPSRLEVLKMNLMVAVGQNMEIGLNGRLPWSLPEYATFKKMVKGSPLPPVGKKNVILSGRNTWISRTMSREHFVNPLWDLINIVISRTLTEVPKGADYVFSSLDSALEFLSQPEQLIQIHEVWIGGGHGLYKAGLKSQVFHRLYLTRVYGDFEHDATFPAIDLSKYCSVRDERLPEGVQEENGIKYQYFVYEKKPNSR
ncbi:dihydrofolate reductase-like isoform X2 [Apostichopus japonicus]|uniref:dihydrofolate reductase-like isoform X2 n=1 Tax=Stichopus japonicus TaxID=307972 RepID=UPI003AB7248F